MAENVKLDGVCRSWV